MGVAHRRLRSQRHASTSSRRTSPATRRRCTPTPATASARTGRSPAASASTRAGSAGASGFVDFDNDGWLDLFLVNGHVYPEVSQLKTEAGYKQRKVVYRNLGNGRFEDVTRAARAAGHDARRPAAARPSATLDNDGDVDVVVNNVHDAPDLFRPRRRPTSHWLTVRLVGTTSNRSAIGARVRVRGRRRRAGRRRCAAAAATVAERSARALRVWEARRRGARRGALAERQRGTVGRRRDEPHRRSDGGRRAAQVTARSPSSVVLR